MADQFQSSSGHTLSSLANVMAEFDAAVKHEGLSPDVAKRLREPRCSIKLSLPVQMDGGHIRTFRAYHTIHSYTLGPSIGGVQYRPGVDPETIEAIAFWSSLRCAVLGIPLGGSWGAVDCDTESLSSGELERISRRFVAELSQFVSPDSDILTADIGTNQQTMCWFMDTYARHSGAFSPAVVLGKPKDLGGIECADNPTALGAALSIRRACKQAGIRLEKARVAIQGFGKVGMNLSVLLEKAGARIVGISDISGAYANEKGIDIKEVVWHAESYGILDGLEGAIDVRKLDDPMDLFKLDAEIIIPAAIELQITERNMTDIRARVIAEVAHDPVSPEADRYLYGRGVTIIPDILCNSGGTVGFYLEWVQNRLCYYWTQERMASEIHAIVGRAYDEVQNLAQKESIPLRLAASVTAVKRLATTAHLRGIYA